jgi:DNA-binding MarR family transcriptional regulator
MDISKLLDKREEGGRARWKIMAYLMKNRNVTLYRIAKTVFGNVYITYTTARYHIDRLKKDELIEKSPADKRISLSTLGESVCRQLKISAIASDRSENLLDGICTLAEKPLDNEMLSKGRGLMTDEVLDVIQKFSSSPSGRKINPISFYFVMRSYIEERDGFLKPYSPMPKRPLDPLSYLPYAIAESVNRLEQERHDLKRLKVYRYVKECGLENDFDELATWFQSIRKQVPVFAMIDKEMPALLIKNALSAILKGLSGLKPLPPEDYLPKRSAT